MLHCNSQPCNPNGEWGLPTLLAATSKTSEAIGRKLLLRFGGPSRILCLMSDKEFALQIIRELPESATLSEISRNIEFLAGIREAELEADRGEVVPHSVVKEESARWLT